MWSKHGPANMLELVLVKHGDKEIAPASHAVTHQVILLWVYTCLLHGVSVNTGHSDQVAPSFLLEYSQEQKLLKMSSITSYTV